MNKRRLRFVILAVAFVSACASATYTRDARSVADVERSYAAYCAPEKPELGGNFVQSADLNRDGAPDYVVDTSEYRCKGAKPFCKASGCEVQIFMSTPAQTLEQRFNGYLPDPPRIEQANAEASLVSGSGKKQRVLNATGSGFDKKKKR